MLKLLLKILVSTGTILVVIFAGLFILARIVSLFAPNYVENLNQQFAEQGLEFSELKVRWRGINPVVEIGQISSSNLLIDDITAELDTLASFWRNTYVFRTIQIDHVSFDLSQQSACVIELPNAEDGSFGFGSLVLHMDNIDLSFRSSIRCGATKFEHEGFFRTVRSNNVYRLHATVRELSDCDHCTIALLYEASSSGFWSSKKERLLNVQAHDFVVPTGLLGWDFLEESMVNAQLLMNGTSHSSSLVGNIDFQPMQRLGDSEGLFLELNFKLEDQGTGGTVDISLLDHNNEVISTLDHSIRHHMEANYIHGWSRDISVENVQAFMSIFGVSDHPVQQWIEGLAPSGVISSLQWVQDQQGLSYLVVVDELQLSQFSNVPTLALEPFSITGRGGLVHADATARQMNMAEAQFLSAPISLASVDFSSVAMWQRDVLGWSNTGQWFPAGGAEPIDFTIDISRNVPMQRQWFRFALATPSISTIHLHPYLGSFLPSEAFDWFDQSVKKGRFDEANLQFVHIVNELNENLTTLELQALVEDAEVIFHEDWPEIVQGTGRFWLTPDALTIEVSSAYTHGNHIENGKIFLPLSKPLLSLEFTADTTFLLLQSYLVESPLNELLPFDALEYDGSGAIDLEAYLKIPLSQEHEDLWDVTLDISLADVSLDIKTAGIQLDDLFGNVGYQFPHSLTSTELSATFHDDPVSLELSTRKGILESEEVVFAFDLETSVSAVTNFTGDWLETIATGSTLAIGEIVIPIDSETAPTVSINSDLIGVTFTLPEPFHKDTDQNRPIQLQLTLDNHLIVDVTWDEVNVHSIIAADAPVRGSIGLGVPPAQLTEATRDWLVSGNLEDLVFATDQASDASLPKGIDIEFDNFHIEKLVRGRFQLHDVLLDGTFGGESSALAVTAEEGNATLSREQDQDWQLSVEGLRLWYSAFDTPDNVPMNPDIFLQLPRIDVSIDGLYMFDENGEAEEFGSWTFALDTTDQTVLLRKINADMRGVNLKTQDDDGIVWDTQKNETRFSGVITGSNLLQVLPEFDVEAEIESENFTVNSDLVWPGSPFDVHPLKMTGRIHGDANEGTLLEVSAGQGILRLLGMFNIAPIIQRMDFDPSAMFAKGFSFDRILYDVHLDQSRVIIQEPIHIKGRSSEVLFTGNANLADESLTMDVVVRLPFSTNLKWYVALITGNPTAFLGTMIGSRIFRPQLNRISSAKYRVEGFFETPEIELIGVFNDDLSEDAPEETSIIEE